MKAPAMNDDRSNRTKSRDRELGKGWMLTAKIVMLSFHTLSCKCGSRDLRLACFIADFYDQTSQVQLFIGKRSRSVVGQFMQMFS
jgi:hypothetical protein